MLPAYVKTLLKPGVRRGKAHIAIGYILTSRLQPPNTSLIRGLTSISFLFQRHTDKNMVKY